MRRKGIFDNAVAFHCQNKDQRSLTGSMKVMSEKIKIFLDFVTIMTQSLRALTGLLLRICMAAIKVCIIRHYISLWELILIARTTVLHLFLMALLDPMLHLQMLSASCHYLLQGILWLHLFVKITTDPSTVQAIHFSQPALSIYAEHTNLSFG